MKDYLSNKLGVSHNDVIAAGDVTIEHKKLMKVYTILNLIGYLLEIGAIVFAQMNDSAAAIFIFSPEDKPTNNQPTIVPLFVNPVF